MTSATNAAAAETGDDGAPFDSTTKPSSLPPLSPDQRDTQSHVSLVTAYVLWLFGGWWGLHHAYLGRPHHALLWYSTFGFWGWGWTRDFFMLPYYVRIANSDPSDPDVRIREATIEARGGVPKWSVLRMAAMCWFGWYFGKIAICAVDLGEEETTYAWVVYTALNAVGAAIGVGMVANVGEETMAENLTAEDSKKGRQYKSLIGASLIGSVIRCPTLAGVYRATRSRRYRPSMIPRWTVAGRFGRHVLWCGAFTAFLALAVFNHGVVNVGGRPVYFREAAWNAYNSDFWRDFNFTEFGESFKTGGGGAGDDYLKRTFDLSGERRARRILGVSSSATHAEVKSAYKKLALKYHPDKVAYDISEKEAEEANRRFIEVQEAYEIMTDLEQRKKEARRRREGKVDGEEGNGGSRGRRSQGEGRDEM